MIDDYVGALLAAPSPLVLLRFLNSAPHGGKLAFWVYSHRPGKHGVIQFFDLRFAEGLFEVGKIVYGSVEPIIALLPGAEGEVIVFPLSAGGVLGVSAVGPSPPA